MATKTYPQLDLQTGVQAADLLASWRGLGPLKRVPASDMKTYVLTDLSSASSSFIADYADAVTRTAQEKMRDSVCFLDFTGSTDQDKWQKALSSGATYVYGMPGRISTIDYAGVRSVNGTDQRYGLTIPDGVWVDGQGQTIKAANGSNCSPFINARAGSEQDADIALMNLIVDLNASNQTSPATGDVGAWYFWDTLRLALMNIRVDNALMYAGRTLKADWITAFNLLCTGSTGDGWSFGTTPDSGEMTNGVFDAIHAIACTGAYGSPDDFQGNGMLFTAINGIAGKVQAKNCAGGIKIQDSSANFALDTAVFIGQTNGSTNSGFKVQGHSDDETLQPDGITVGKVISVDAYGNGLHITAAKRTVIGAYIGSGNGTGGGASGSDQYDIAFDLLAGGYVEVSTWTSTNPGAGYLFTAGDGDINIGTGFGDGATGVAVQHTGGRMRADTITGNGASVTRALKVTGGTGTVSFLKTDQPFDAAERRLEIQAGVYNFHVTNVELGNDDGTSGVVSIGSGVTHVDVACDNVSRTYEGGASDYCQPAILVSPWTDAAAVLGNFRVTVNDSNTTGGFRISWTTATVDTTAKLYWKVLDWQLFPAPST